MASQVYDYLRHFLSSCVQLTSLEISAHSVDATSIGGCIVTCATVPIGISPDESPGVSGVTGDRKRFVFWGWVGGADVILNICGVFWGLGLPMTTLGQSLGRMNSYEVFSTH